MYNTTLDIMNCKTNKIDFIIVLVLAIILACGLSFAQNLWLQSLAYVIPVLFLIMLGLIRGDWKSSFYHMHLPKRRETICVSAVMAGTLTLAIGLRFLGQYLVALLPFSTFLGTKVVPQTSITGFLIAMVFIPAIFGEILHRGYLLSRLVVISKEKTGRAIFFSAVIFAVLSLDIAQFLPQMALGIAAAWVVIETKNLLFPMVFAMLNNLLVSLERILLANPNSRIQESLGASMTIPQVIGILFICAAVAFVSIYFGGRNLHQRQKSTLSELLILFLCAFIFLLIGSAFTFFGRGAI